ncbi:hypothetical protein TTHERM_000002658 (macronuclear) [Tetrahymena thermophila SB210]|uniref:Uncharacterized protein n=1 Tax=Tetrahymena thermophila (strain SB210) TaxID=312017 RepID=W7XLH5_TETTS|nr:hypothetical protein TTHERM_000002658 [Tetrahymena thermophila SB210]EWS76299.1 hypothetical protein TTHERM_000002658 [Tetrahymena thermophila SB210]|eukprot:XP_012651083.1 hypothetical protein TTHERM_000002658 [Tetrahymena thermophila SB210]
MILKISIFREQFQLKNNQKSVIRNKTKLPFNKMKIYLKILQFKQNAIQKKVSNLVSINQNILIIAFQLQIFYQMLSQDLFLVILWANRVLNVCLNLQGNQNAQVLYYFLQKKETIQEQKVFKFQVKASKNQKIQIAQNCTLTPKEMIFSGKKVAKQQNLSSIQKKSNYWSTRYLIAKITQLRESGYFLILYLI